MITGGGTGIGKATALLFASEGASLVLAGRRTEPLQQTADEIVQRCGKAEYVVADVTESAQVQRMLDRAVGTFRKIVVLFNSAGAFISRKEAHEYTEQEWDKIMRVNFWGTLLGSKYVVPHLKRNGGGVILNCTSVSGRVAQRMQAGRLTLRRKRFMTSGRSPRVRMQSRSQNLSLFKRWGCKSARRKWHMRRSAGGCGAGAGRVR